MYIYMYMYIYIYIYIYFPAVGLCIGPYGGPKGGGLFIMSEGLPLKLLKFNFVSDLSERDFDTTSSCVLHRPGACFLF